MSQKEEFNIEHIKNVFEMWEKKSSPQTDSIKEVFNQAFMDSFIFGQSCIVVDDKGSIRRVHPMSEEFKKFKEKNYGNSTN